MRTAILAAIPAILGGALLGPMTGIAPARAEVVQFLAVPRVEEVLRLIAPEAVPATDPTQRMGGGGAATERIIRPSPGGADLTGAVELPPAQQAPPAQGSRPVRPRPRPARPGPTPAIAVPGAFGLASAELPEEVRAHLAVWARALREAGGATVLVTGHTDSTGSAATNEALSLRRAVAARQFMIREGSLDGARIAVSGMGPRAPMIGTRPDDPVNRRIQLWRMQGDSAGD